MSITILLVDDHAVVRQGLRMLLSAYNEMHIVGETDDGTTAVELAQTLQPNVILMDLLLPTMNGVEATRQIKARRIPSAILVLTATLQSQHVQDAMRAGASGYILKATHAEGLINAIKQVALGKRTMDAMITDVLFDGLAYQDTLTDLTTREHEVLCAVARGYSNVHIADQLAISEATVRFHLANLLSKLNLRDRTSMMAFALKRGIVSVDDIDDTYL